jgi:two-component system, OmpR family, sensor kinase
LHRDMVPAAQIVECFVDMPLPISGDAKLLFQAFSNLLSNAVKYSTDGGGIEVVAERTGAEAIVSITDHGIGIPPNDLERLFERYHRGSNVSGIVGTGVGLYLVKMVVDRHGGRVMVQSREGEGSCFTIHLPLAHAAAGKQAPPLEPLAAAPTAAPQQG